MIKARACAGDIAAGEAILRAARALHLAQVSRLRGGRRRRRRMKRQIHAYRGHERDRGRGPQHQARPRRHPRDRVLRADPAADRRRPASRTARPRDAADAGGARRRRLDRRRGARRSRRGLSVPAHRRAPPADGGRRADPHAAVRPRGLERFARFAGFKDRDAFAQDAARASAQGAAPIHRSCSRTRSARAERLRAVLSRGRRRPRDARPARRAWASASRWRSRPRCGAGWPAPIRRCAASSRARQFAELVPVLLDRLARAENPDAALNAFDGSSAGCKRGARLFSLLRQNPGSGRAGRADARHRAAARRYPGALSAGDGRAARADVLRRAAGRGQARGRACAHASARRAPTRIFSTGCACSARSRCS